MISSVLTGRKFTILLLALLAVGIGVSYSNGFDIGFWFDGTYGIANNPAIRSLKNIPSFFVDPHAIWTEHTQVDLRPFLLITFALNHAISGLEPWSYHVFNLMLHFTGSFLVFIIVRDHLWSPASDRGPLGDARIPAAAAALFFALAPLNSQPVNYIWARSSLLCVTLYLGAFLALLRCRWGLGYFLQVLALLTKAIAVTLPLTVLLYDFIYRDRTRHPTVTTYLRDWKRLIPLVLVTGIISLAYVGYRFAMLPDWAESARRASWITPWVWFMSAWSALLYYVRLFVWPDGLSIDHDFPYATSLLAPRAWLSLLVLLGWVAVALRLVKRYPEVTFATLWFFVTLAPVSTFAPLAEVINDHRPYIATSLGLSVLLAWILRQGSVWVAPRAWKTVFVSICLLLMIPAVGFNRYRTWQWGDEIRLWEDTIRKSPGQGRAWMNAGLIYMRRGELDRARTYFVRAKQESPNYAYIYMNLSVVEAAKGNLDEGLINAEKAVRLQPGLALTHYYLGRILEQMEQTDEAAAAYAKSLALNPRHTVAQLALARLKSPVDSKEAAMMKAGMLAMYERNEPGQAATEFRSVLEINPTHYGATYQLAVALDRLGKANEARPYWEKVLTMATEYKDAETAATARTRLKALP